MQNGLGVNIKNAYSVFEKKKHSKQYTTPGRFRNLTVCFPKKKEKKMQSGNYCVRRLRKGYRYRHYLQRYPERHYEIPLLSVFNTLPKV